MRVKWLRQRGALQWFTVSTLSLCVSEPNIIEAKWWLTVWTLSVRAVALNQGDLPGFCQFTKSGLQSREVRSDGGQQRDITALTDGRRSGSSDTVPLQMLCSALFGSIWRSNKHSFWWTCLQSASGQQWKKNQTFYFSESSNKTEKNGQKHPPRS